MIACFAIVSELPFDLAFFSQYSIFENTYPFYWGYQNVFFTLLLGMAALWVVEKFRCVSGSKREVAKSIIFRAVGISVLAAIASIIHSDYEAYGVLLIVGFYVCRKNRLYQAIVFLIIFIATSGNQPMLTEMASVVILLLYNGNRGKLRLKYIFYVFYPLHIILLYLITIILQMQNCSV